MEVMVFGKQGCTACQTTKNKFKHYIEKYDFVNKVKLNFYDMEDIDGLSEGAMHNVINIPTTIFKKQDNELVRWDGEVPKRQDFESYFQS